MKHTDKKYKKMAKKAGLKLPETWTLKLLKLS